MYRGASTYRRIEGALDRLGINGASTPMGAIELLSLKVREGTERLAAGLHDVAAALRGEQA
jgi:hypothetical protein